MTQNDSLTTALARTGSTRAAVPAALRARRRTRAAAPTALFAVAALALGAAVLPGTFGSRPATAAEAPSVQELSSQQAQAYQASLADVASPAVARDAASVEVETPTPTPTPSASSSGSGSSGSGSGSSSGGSSSGGSGASESSGYIAPAGEAQQIAHDIVLSRGWGEGEFACLVNLWNRESGWRVTAANPSGAYGIPQALPGSKMSSAGADWQTNAATQITWGLGYIADRYATPCGAWGHSESFGWY